MSHFGEPSEAVVAGAGVDRRHLGSPRLESDPVVVVVTCWEQRDDETKQLGRLLAGSLAIERPVSIVSLEDDGDHCAPVSFDGIFPLYKVPGGGPRPRLGSLFQPERFDKELEGDLAATGFATPDAALQVIHELSPEVVVVLGIEALSVAAALAHSHSGRRLVALPLAGPRRFVSSRRLGRVFGGVDLVVGFSKREEELVRAGLHSTAGAQVASVQLSFPVSDEAESRDLAGLATEASYPLLITDWQGEPAMDRLEHDAWRELLGAEAIVELGSDRWLVTEPGRSHEVAFPPTRFDAWRLMAGATATVDLRQPGPVGQAALESLLLGTPVLVPAESTAACYVAESAGGLTYKDPAELVTGLSRLLGTSGLGEELAGAAKTWAASACTTPSDTARQLRRLVLGT